MLFDPSSKSLPKRSELPSIPDAPDGAAWFWGKDDELGRLNLLTPARTAAAAKLIKSGERINLNLRADLPNPPVFGRETFTHKIKSLGPGVYDDLYNLNTQSGSQWDGFRHVGKDHGGGFVWYNGLTEDEIHKSSRCGMQAWADHGIVGRAVLIDYKSFTKKDYSALTTHRITLSEIKECAAAQNVTFEYGDILIIRSGFISEYHQLGEEQRKDLSSKSFAELAFTGVEQSWEMVDFLHDNYFAAVAGDAPAFEAWPSPPGTDPGSLHRYLLPRWGCPIGEMWDLERLAEVCKREKQYSFFFSSIPTNVAGMCMC